MYVCLCVCVWVYCALSQLNDVRRETDRRTMEEAKSKMFQKSSSPSIIFNIMCIGHFYGMDRINAWPYSLNSYSSSRRFYLRQLIFIRPLAIASPIQMFHIFFVFFCCPTLSDFIFKERLRIYTYPVYFFFLLMCVTRAIFCEYNFLDH